MTHSGGKPHTNVGDRGQRYEVRATGYPHEGQQSVIGWSNHFAGAVSMAAAIHKAPGCIATEIFDRVEQNVVDGCRCAHLSDNDGD